ncbi:MAG: hypothetical protein Q9162_005692 [Coniocarpon cinnabarinum]
MLILKQSSALIWFSFLLTAPQVFGQAVGNNPAPANNPPPGNNPAPAPTTTNAPTQPTTAAAATTASTGTTGTDSQTTGPTTTNEPTTSDTASTTTSASRTTPTSPTASFATTNDPSTSTNPPLPTLAGVLPPPLIVPDTSNAPFMQKSDLPEGTVFICVGAALGFLGLCVLAWRGLVAWSLHRSVKRAAETAYAPDSKSMFGWGAPAPGSAGYKSMYTDSNMSLEMLSNPKMASVGTGEIHNGKSKEDFRHEKRSGGQSKRNTRVPSSTDLFYSPTNLGGNTNAACNRGSGYMPAGFYAPGSSQPNSGNPIAHFARGSDGPTYGRLASRDTATPSPPDSPSMRAHSRPQSTHLRPGSAAGAATNQRHSTRLSRDALAEHDAAQARRRSRRAPSGDASLNAPPQGRAPSMYLEDLFENHGHGPSERF